MVVDMLLVMFVFYLSIPGVAAYFAHTNNRNWVTWFIFALFLPVIAHTVLIILTAIDDKKRAQNKMLTSDEERHMEAVIAKSIRDAHYGTTYIQREEKQDEDDEEFLRQF